MSSWDRARYIPWEKIPQSGDNLDTQKDRIIRELQREALQQKPPPQQQQAGGQQQQQQQQGTTDTTAQVQDGADKTTLEVSTKEPYTHMGLLRQAAFGGCIGSITGVVFGFMDGMRTGGQSQVLQKASNMAKFRYLMQGTTRSGAVFGVFYGGFHVLKYGLRVTLDPGEAGEIVVAGAASMGGLMAKPQYRPFMPYGSMLIIMDIAHIVMREMDKD